MLRIGVTIPHLRPAPQPNLPQSPPSCPGPYPHPIKPRSANFALASERCCLANPGCCSRGPGRHGRSPSTSIPGPLLSPDTRALSQPRLRAPGSGLRAPETQPRPPLLSGVVSGFCFPGRWGGEEIRAAEGEGGRRPCLPEGPGLE